MTDSANVPSVEVTAAIQEDGTILVEWPYDRRLWEHVKGVPFLAVVITIGNNAIVVRFDIYPLSDGQVVVWPRWEGTTTIHTVIGPSDVDTDEIRDRVKPGDFFRLILPPETNVPSCEAGAERAIRRMTACQVAVANRIGGLQLLGDPHVTQVTIEATPKTPQMTYPEPM